MGASTLRYSPSGAFETFPFPPPDDGQIAALEALGARYHAHRQWLLLSLQVGLTKLYNQLHNETLRSEKREAGQEAEALAATLSALSEAEVKAQYGKTTWELLRQVQAIAGTRFRPRDMSALLRGESIEQGEAVPAATLAEAIAGIWELRRLQVEMDEAVLAAYGWSPRTDARQGVPPPPTRPDPTYAQPIALRHGFYEVDYLPENDRVRFTIHPDARKEVLRRLLLLNHARYAAEVAAGLHGEAALRAYNKAKGKGPKTPELFG